MRAEGAPVGVLGLGSIGMRHARNLIELGRPVIGFDPDPERRALLDRVGGRAVAQRAAALDCSAIVIASPPAQHFDDLTDAVSQGCSCLVEKPLAHTNRGLPEILESAEQKRLVIFVGFMLRFHAAVCLAKAMLADGRVGRPLWSRILASAYLPLWRPNQDYRRGYAADPATGGVLYDDVHEIDLALHLLGPARLTGAGAATSGTLDLPSEDIAQLLLRHDCGTLSMIHLDFCSRPPRREVEIVGSEAALRLDLLGRRLQLVAHDGRIVDDRNLPGSFDLDYLEEMRCFLDCLRGRAQPPCDGWDGLAALDIVLGARHACGLPSR